MATKEEHLAEVARNEALAAKLSELGEFGWGLTLLFYAAVHMMSAYFVQSGSRFTTHAAREVAMRRDRTLDQVSRHYDELKRQSEYARYDCKAMSRADFERSRIRYGRLQGHMQRLVS